MNANFMKARQHRSLLTNYSRRSLRTCLSLWTLRSWQPRLTVSARHARLAGRPRWTWRTILARGTCTTPITAIFTQSVKVGFVPLGPSFPSFPGGPSGPTDPGGPGGPAGPGFFASSIKSSTSASSRVISSLNFLFSAVCILCVWTK